MPKREIVTCPLKYNDDIDYVTEYMYFTLNPFSSTLVLLCFYEAKKKMI